MRQWFPVVLLVCVLSATPLGQSGCSNPSSSNAKAKASEPQVAPKLPTPVTLSIIGTNDVHGALDRLPMFAGFVNNLREQRKADGGVAVIDGGDMFQGTIESNINEGEAIIDAFGAIGYAAVTVGNHEFDFGPAGDLTTPESEGDDPRGALKERMRQAKFPLLTANILDKQTGERVNWPNAPASVIHNVAGVEVGIIGVTAEATLKMTMAANVMDLEMAPITETVVREARALRDRGAKVVVVAAHAGGRCRNFSNPDDVSSCKTDDEIMQVARELPRGLVDVIVGGHTHQGVAHRVNGIAIIESYARGVAFGRVDVTLDASTGKISETKIFPPQSICQGKKRVPISECQPGDYAGKPVVADAKVAAVIADAMASADKIRERSLGVEITSTIQKYYKKESPLGNLFADLMREARGADVAITNAGGLRAVLPSGKLTYGHLYESTPFDNRFATVELTGGQLSRLLADSLTNTIGILLVSGARAKATCKDEQLVVTVRRDNGKPIADDEVLTVATSDFLATAKDGSFDRLGLPDDAVTVDSGPNIRDRMAELLIKRGGTLAGDDPQIFDPENPRIEYKGRRPVKCPAD